LKWLYLKAMVDGNRHPALNAADIASTVDWQDEPLTTPEVEQASDWLLEEGYISGSSSSGHGVGRPSITPKGEAFADSGKSVRGGNEVARPQGTTIHISDSTNVAIGSPGTTQTYTVADQVKRVNAVADALEKAADHDSDASPEAATEARRIAAKIRAEASKPQPSPSRLKQFVLAAVTAGAGALGQAAVTDVVHLASHALQTL
jgi:hypothetical protein